MAILLCAGVSGTVANFPVVFFDWEGGDGFFLLSGTLGGGLIIEVTESVSIGGFGASINVIPPQSSLPPPPAGAAQTPIPFKAPKGTIVFGSNGAGGGTFTNLTASVFKA